MKITLIIIFTFILCIPLADAQEAVNSTYRFLQLPVSARTAALGGDAISLPDGNVSEFQVNPSYLQESSQDKLSLSYINQISDINMAFLNGAYYVSGIGTFGGGIRYLNYGKFTHTNAQGQALGSFNAYDMAVSMGIGRMYMKNVYYGGAIEYIHSSYAQYHSSAVAISLGGRYRIPQDHLTFGVAITNFGTQLSRFNDVHENLPLNISVGVSRRLTHMPLRISLTLHSLNRWNLRILTDQHNPTFATDLVRHVRIGGEFLFSKHVILRLGYNRLLHEELKTSNRIDLAGTSIGLGINVNKVQFDISRNSYSQLGAFTQISLSTSL